MADVTVIGRGAHISGRVIGAVDLEIHGRVDGDVAVDGEVTVEAQGLVGANVSAKRLVVRGAVKGDLTGEEAVRLEEGARVVGDVRAPRVAIAAGALVRGYVQTGEAQAGGARGKAHTASRSASHATTKAMPVAAKRAAPPRASVLAGGAPKPKGPPAPVVPALKKGAKGSLKRKAG
jgi:cytoskeletal protein CcmA (bactofilin family)